MPRRQTVNKPGRTGTGTMVEAAGSLEGASGRPGEEEWLGILVDHLYEEREPKRPENPVGAADLPCPDAHVEDPVTDAGRRLDPGPIDRLVACTHVTRGHGVILLGASGAGRPRLSSALAPSACRRCHRVERVSMADMVDELATLRLDSEAHKRRINQPRRKDLLVVDDRLPGEAMSEAVDGPCAVVSARARARRPAIVCSQYLIEGRPSGMGSYPEAESVVDRPRNNSYRLELGGEASMRGRCMDEEPGAYAARQKKDQGRTARGLPAASVDAGPARPRGLDGRRRLRPTGARDVDASPYGPLFEIAVDMAHERFGHGTFATIYDDEVTILPIAHPELFDDGGSGTYREL